MWTYKKKCYRETSVLVRPGSILAHNKYIQADDASHQTRSYPPKEVERPRDEKGKNADSVLGKEAKITDSDRPVRVLMQKT